MLKQIEYGKNNLRLRRARKCEVGFMRLEEWMEFSEEVLAAKEKGLPIVAIESVVLSFGLPKPDNLRVHRAIENEIRKRGVVPATIAIIDGKLKIGLSETELERLAESKGVEKASKRDLAWMIVKKRTGALTVAATMVAAHLARIKIMVTGGIGGVARKAEENFDISTDLTELSRTPVAVVSSGVKSIMDLRKTVEFLETMGVPVIGYKTDRFPAFYFKTTDYPVVKFDSAEEVASLLKFKFKARIPGGVLVVNPVSKGLEDVMPQEKAEKLIEKAIIEAEMKGVKGGAVTPFVLSRLVEMTDREVLKVNERLLLENAVLAANIASAYYL